jgi:hypothetical protein
VHGLLLRACFGVIAANVRCKFFVALQLEVGHHFIERFTGGHGRSSEPPPTFGATETSKTLLLNPYQPSGHGSSVAAPNQYLRDVKG